MSRAADRSLTPALLVLLGGEVRDLAPALSLAVARRSRRAARLVASVDASGRPGDLPRLFRAGVERVTDVRVRAAALRAGYSVRDELLVFPAFALGGEAPSPDALRDALEAVVRLSTDFYRGTRVNVQALVLLPDLSADREVRYARAYAQLAELDRAAGSAAPRLDGGPLLSRRWLCDCRTHTGAYAGRVADVIHPVAEFLSLMVVESGAPQMDAAFEPALRAAAAGRSAGYSAPGYAEIGVRRRLVARYMACRL
ncbi:MAG TPA: hypothetical protein VGX50_20055, partial [Longimicrobium sp.]|nr:hypothetical protein [Longimicrobium sp.]